MNGKPIMNTQQTRNKADFSSSAILRSAAHTVRSLSARGAECVGTWCGTHRRIVRSVSVRDVSLVYSCEKLVESYIYYFVEIYR